MSSTIKQAILSLKSRIADAYTAIAAKGGTMPATQDSANLPTAIESIHGGGDYDMISGIRLSDDPSDPSAPTRPLPDGMSLAQLLYSSVINGILEITDSNTDWTLNKTLNVSLFPNMSKVTLGMRKSTAKVISNCSKFTEIKTTNYKEAAVNSFVAFPNVSIEEFVIDVEYINIINPEGAFSSGTYRKIRLPKTKKYKSWNGGTFRGDNLEEIDMSALDEHIGLNWSKLTWDSPLKCVRWGTMKRFDTPYFGDNTSNLILMVFGQGTGVSLNLKHWHPTNALDASRTDLIEEGSTATNNLQQFLSNFKTYIAERLADNGSGKTLTLSQEVRDAIQQDPEIVSIITGKGWTISPAPTA